MYLALVFLVLLGKDAWEAMWFTNPTGGESFGLSIGSLVLTINVCLLSSYVFGCHSLRHIVGGALDRISRSKPRSVAYGCVGCFNRRHMLFAWMSLFWVGFSDIYVRLCSMGIWSDWRFF
jgi:hypothetical protein